MPATLLLADDSVTIQRVIELTFADEDVRVVAVSDGDQAIARLDEQPPDIVLADVGMPGKNGYEVASYIKSQPRLAHIPVLLLTGAFEPIDQVKADAGLRRRAGQTVRAAARHQPRQGAARPRRRRIGAGGRAREDRATRGFLRTADTPAAARVVSGDAAVTPSSLVDYFDRARRRVREVAGRPGGRLRHAR